MMGNMRESGGISGTVTLVGNGDGFGIIGIEIADFATLASNNWQFVQTEDATEKGVAIHRWGGIIYPTNVESVDLEIFNPNTGVSMYAAATALPVVVGDTITFEEGE